MPSTPGATAHHRGWPWGLGATLMLVLVRMLYAGQVELAPQEAYYWQYTRHLDLSYLDHPPMCAWWMALSVRLLGDSQLALRLPAILSSALPGGALYSLGKRLYSPAVGLLTAVAANATVLFGLGSGPPLRVRGRCVSCPP